MGIGIIAYMALMSRLSGMRWPLLDRYQITWLPELFFAFGLGAAPAYLTHGAVMAWLEPYAAGWLVSLCAWLAAIFVFNRAVAWAYIWMQTGHGAILHWGMEPVRDPDRKQFLTPFVDWLSARLGIVKNSTPYCRLFMAVKGFLIGLPVGGVVLAVLWPLAYEIGARLRGKVRFDPHALAEVLAGAGAGLAIVIFMAMFN